MYYLQSRYYDPEICRWINADSFASTGQGIVGCNMFAYCLNNPTNLIDKTGQDAATLAAEWGATMWWLYWVDGLLPVGDIIYWGGWGLLTIGAIIFVDYAATAYDTSYSKPTSSGEPSFEAQAQFIHDYGSTAAPPNPGNNRRNWQYKKEKYLEKQLEKQGTDPHAVKREYLGSNAHISRYDLWVDKGTGQVAIVEKATGRIVEVTYYFIY